MKVRTIIISDPIGGAGQGYEEEIAEIAKQLHALVGLDIDLVASGMGMHEAKDKRADLLVIDYGGMSWGSDTATWQVRAAFEWAELHPGSLVILWTWHTRDIYERELQREFSGMENVIMRYGAQMFDDLWDEMVARLRTHFGVTELPAPEPLDLETPGRQS